MEMIGESCIYHKAQNFTRVTNYIISSSWGVALSWLRRALCRFPKLSRRQRNRCDERPPSHKGLPRHGCRLGSLSAAPDPATQIVVDEDQANDFEFSGTSW
jgi:hypothetical protein